MSRNSEMLSAINSFKINVEFNKTRNPSTDKVSSHIHEVCEIYVNLTGDVSFIVEDAVYPIKPGDIIIKTMNISGFYFHLTGMKNCLICFSTALWAKETT